MNHRENLLSLYCRQGFDAAPVGMHLCPDLIEMFKRRHPGQDDYLEAIVFSACVIFALSRFRVRKVSDGASLIGHTAIPEEPI